MTDAASRPSTRRPASGRGDVDAARARARLARDLRRRPRSAGEFAADGLRVLGALGVVAAVLWMTTTAAGVLAFVLPGMLLPRLVGARPAFDLVFCATLLVAAWSNVLGVYDAVTWWDLVVHFACTGVIAAALVLLLAGLGLVTAPAPRRSRAARPSTAGLVAVTAAVGLAASALWEMVEWLGHAVIGDEIFVSYDDTIADLALGGLGAIAAGFAVALLPLSRE